jgi:hypothetical protein
MDETNSIPAAWHDDPAGSGGQRWWDGNAWTEHVRPSEAPAFPTFPVQQVYQPAQPVQPAQSNPYFAQAQLTQQAQQAQQAQPAQQVQPFHPVEPYQPIQPYQAVQPAIPTAYSPFGSQASSPSPGWYADASRNAVNINNSAGWISLGAGVVGLGIVVVSSLLGSDTYVLYLPLVLAVVYGIRSLAQRAAGTSTSLVAPILGIICGVVAAGLFGLALLGALFLSQNPSSVPDESPGTEQVDTAGDGTEMAMMLATADVIQQSLHQQFPAGDWPAALTVEADGTIRADGSHVAILSAGLSIEYTLVDPANFTFRMVGTVPGEAVVYESSANAFTLECNEGDTACDTVSLA